MLKLRVKAIAHSPQYFSLSGAVTLKGAATGTKPAMAGYALEAATAAFAPIAPGFSLWA